MEKDSVQMVDPTRREAMRFALAGGAMLVAGMPPAFAATFAQGAPEQAFLAAFDVPVDKPVAGTATRLAFLHEEALIIDHDAPFPMTKVGYADHLDFRMANLQRSETRFHELRSVPHGNGAIVSAYFIERSKPKDAGFRLRAGYCTAVCTRVAGEWKALSLHMSPLTAQVTDASPG
jgi:hypothetical protein